MSDTEVACAAIIIAHLTRKPLRKRKRKQRIWTKEWLKKRSSLSHDRSIAELRLTSEADYKSYLRIDSETFGELLEMVTPYIEKQTTVMREPISAQQRLFATLRYLVTGRTFEELKFETSIAAQTLGNIIMQTCEALVYVLHSYIKIPANEQEWKRVATEFEKKWNFPHCLGAIGGKHITIKKPPGTGSCYYNYKKSFSIVLLAMINANYEFIMVDVGANGRVSDRGVFSNSQLYEPFVGKKLHIPEPQQLPNTDTESPYVLVGDDAFPLMDTLMKPFSGKNMTHEQTIFNYRLSRVHRIVENAFGLLTSRFRILLREINLSPEKAAKIVLACTYLHNFLLMKKVEYYYEGGLDVEDTSTGEILYGDWRSGGTLLPLQPLSVENTPASSEEIRFQFSRYFSNAGALPWQQKMLSEHRVIT